MAAARFAEHVFMVSPRDTRFQQNRLFTSPHICASLAFFFLVTHRLNYLFSPARILGRRTAFKLKPSSDGAARQPPRENQLNVPFQTQSPFRVSWDQFSSRI